MKTRLRPSQIRLLVVLLVLFQPFQLWAHSAERPRLVPVAGGGPGQAIEPVRSVGRLRFEFGAVTESRNPSPQLAVTESSGTSSASRGRAPGGSAVAGGLTGAIRRQPFGPTVSAASRRAAVMWSQQAVSPKRNWIGRHPVLFGSLVGFGGGFLIGYLPGDDGIFDDYTAGFNGLVLGGIGAGAGALVGAIVGAATK